MKKTLFAVLPVLCWLLLSLNVFGQKLYLLPGGDFKNEIVGATAREGTQFLISLFTDNVPSDRLVIYNNNDSWKGPEINSPESLPGDLTAAIAACPADPEDAILVYWFGYGSILRNEYYLRADSVSSPNRILRSDIVQALKNKRVRFAALITESGRQFRSYREGDFPFHTPNANKLTPLMTALFFNSQGLLDINSAARRQNPIIIKSRGGAFTEAFAAGLEQYDYKEVNWSEMIARCERIMADRYRGEPQTVDVFSMPDNSGSTADNQTGNQRNVNQAESQTAPDNTVATGRNRSNKTSGSGLAIPRTQFPRRSARNTPNTKLDWNNYAADWQQRERERTAEPYPQDYLAGTGESGYRPGMQAPRFSSGYWSAPLYRPEAGDLLLGINGVQIFTYNQFLAAIQQSPSVIYLTLADSWTGQIYEMRTWMTAAAGQRIRLGLVVMNDAYTYGGLRITGVMAFSPASHCQYRLQSLDYYYPAPIRRYRPVPVPVPGPQPQPFNPDPPVPVPVPGPQPQPYNPNPPTPVPVPGPQPQPFNPDPPTPVPVPGPQPQPFNPDPPTPVPTPGPQPQPFNPDPPTPAPNPTPDDPPTDAGSSSEPEGM